MTVLPAQHLRAVAAPHASRSSSRSRSSPTSPASTCSTSPTRSGSPTAFQFLAPVVAVAFAGADRAGVADRGAPLPEHRLVIRVDATSRSRSRVWRAQGPRAPARESSCTRSTTCRSRVDAGEMVGYVGPNGAGKSTTIKMLTGVLVPSSGDGRRRRAGPAPRTRRRSRAASASCSVSARCCGGTFRSPTRSTCCATSTGSTNAQHRARLDECIELLELDEFLDHAGAAALARPTDAGRADRGAAARTRSCSSSTSRRSASMS